MAKERALRRQTLSGCEADGREAAARLAAADAAAAKEARARDEAEKKAAAAENQLRTLQIELDEAKRELARVKVRLFYLLSRYGLFRQTWRLLKDARRKLNEAVKKELLQTQDFAPYKSSCTSKPG